MILDFILTPSGVDVESRKFFFISSHINLLRKTSLDFICTFLLSLNIFIDNVLKGMN